MIATLTVAAVAAQEVRDWANFGRYEEANSTLSTAPCAVFMGNSITDSWIDNSPTFFADNNYVDRGISGQVTSQMLARFRPDVLDLQPKVVVILAGINDIARNDGYISIPNIAGNIFSMAELAKMHKIKVVICSVLPASHFPWNTEIANVPAMVVELNGMLKEWADENGCTYLDYHSAMDDGNGGLSAELSGDGVHPTKQGYGVMEHLVKPVIDKIAKR
jgi:lysophospholipase L1-like esterase